MEILWFRNLNHCFLVRKLTFYNQSKLMTTNVSDNVISFFVLMFVLLVNLYYNAKLVEGIVHRLPYKILPWVILNIVNLIQAAIYFFKVDNMIGYLSLIIFCYIWMVVVTLFFETQKSTKEEHMECTQQTSDVEYNNFSSDKQDVWSEINKNNFQQT